jgi:hypothetical protein
MSRSKASKVLLIVVAMLLGWGSAIQLARYPARLRGSLGIRHYINMEYARRENPGNGGTRRKQP